jgi:membrane protein DedA with SNARE-associated domain
MVKRNSSLGVLISTLVFFFAGFWLVLEGKSLLENQEILKGILVILGGVLSLLAAFRFRIQKFFENWRN